MNSCGQNIIATTICSIIGIVIISVVLNIDLSKTSSADFIIAVLSLLVTILIGWQIYTVVDFKNNIRKAEKDYNKLKKHTADVSTVAYDANVLTNYALYQFYMETKKPAGAITSLISSLSNMVEIDMARHNKNGNIERISHYLSEALNTQIKFKFGDNNMIIIEETIPKIRENKDYHYIKKLFEKSFEKIEERISKEKATINSSEN